MMLRHPVARTVSGYLGDNGVGLHSCGALRRKYHCGATGPCDGDSGAPGLWFKNFTAIPPMEYARCVENCMANMLTGRRCQARGLPDVPKAVQVVRAAAFVGLTDHWLLSICLFHAKFGGRVFREELANLRPGVLAKAQAASQDPRYRWYRAKAAAHLADWQPRADTEVYAAALVRFRQELARHGPTLCELGS